ncbi:MAG: DUF4268 domain-containing protein [Gammaproteobacteria bacterium]|nr:DUF4268 domain-containing protein [Gammaproteobacteria bacterium]
MTIYRVTNSALSKVDETTFAQEKLLERRDLQRLLKSDISVLSPELMVISEEFGDWEESARRIDLLCLDRQGQLIVVEIKRTEDGGHMELQAIRYAAMVSSMTFAQLVLAHARYLGGEDAPQRAESDILAHLKWDTPEEGNLSEDVGIILVSADFSRELTTAVLWLRKRGLNITCIRLKPYRLDEQILIDVQTIIPLPEAAEYEIRVREKTQASQRANSAREDIFLRFWAQLIERSKPHSSLIANRSPVPDHWLGGGIGKAGFTLNYVVRQHDSQVECYIDYGKDWGEKNIAAFHALEAQVADIEQNFGAKLDWDELPQSRGCRISKVVDGGWKTPETGWPDLQNRLIDHMANLEKALRAPIQRLNI